MSNFDLESLWGQVRSVLEYPLFSLGDQEVTALRISLFIVCLVIVRVSSRAVNKLTQRSLRGGTRDRRSIQGVAKLTEMIAAVVGLIIVFDLVGFNIRAFLALFAALGVGIGFGLQNLVNNFVSGIIVLLEQPVRPGDFIQVDGEAGEVVNIGLRAIRVINNDGVEIIIPNSKILENSLINWTLSQPTFRLSVSFGVHYHSDPEQVREVALDVASQHEGLKKIPEPTVQFMDYGDSSLDFRLLVWFQEPWDRWKVTSDLRFALFKAFSAAGIEIPYPQRDLHLRSSAIEISS